MDDGMSETTYVAVSMTAVMAAVEVVWTHIKVVQELLELLLAKLGALVLELGLEGSDPLVMVAVGAHRCHVVGIGVPKGIEGLADGCDGDLLFVMCVLRADSQRPGGTE